MTCFNLGLKCEIFELKILNRIRVFEIFSCKQGQSFGVWAEPPYLSTLPPLASEPHQLIVHRNSNMLGVLETKFLVLQALESQRFRPQEPQHLCSRALKVDIS